MKAKKAQDRTATLEDAASKITQDLHKTESKIKYSDEFTRKELEETHKELEQISDEINSVVQWKSFAYVKGFIGRHKDTDYILSISDMIANKQLMSVPEATKHLKLTSEAFYTGIRNDCISYIKFLRLRAETLIESDLDSIRDLQSPEKIGEYGQRLTDFFAAVKTRYPYPEQSLPKVVVNLVNREDDICTLVFKSVDLAMRYQAMNDLVTYIFASISADLIKLKDEKTKLDTSMDALRLSSKALQEENQRLIDENDKLAARNDALIEQNNSLERGERPEKKELEKKEETEKKEESEDEEENEDEESDDEPPDSDIKPVRE